MKNDTAPEPAGLVISDKTSRPTESGLYEASFVSPEDVKAAAALLPSSITKLGPQFWIEVSPALVRTKRTTPRLERPSRTPPPRKPITEWSRKSRSQMVATLCELDYTPMLLVDDALPAMITLTYPGAWEVVAPDAATTYRHLKAFRQRYERRWGRRLLGLWKREFQRRGAPHFHLFLVPPNDDDFRPWLSKAWADIVAHPDSAERARHLEAGTGIDWANGLKATDPQRVAVYFSKHSAANFGDKEYQNRPPELWGDSDSVGRFWGRWGLDKATVAVPVQHQDAVAAARILRRWAHANSTPRRVKVFRTTIRTGEIKLRHATRRIRRMRGSSGYLAHARSPTLARDLARYLAASS